LTDNPINFVLEENCRAGPIAEWYSKIAKARRNNTSKKKNIYIYVYIVPRT
jgi:hypothetical protein